GSQPPAFPAAAPARRAAMFPRSQAARRTPAVQCRTWEVPPSGLSHAQPATTRVACPIDAPEIVLNRASRSSIACLRLLTNCRAQRNCPIALGGPPGVGRATRARSVGKTSTIMEVSVAREFEAGGGRKILNREQDRGAGPIGNRARPKILAQKNIL